MSITKFSHVRQNIANNRKFGQITIVKSTDNRIDWLIRDVFNL